MTNQYIYCSPEHEINNDAIFIKTVVGPVCECSTIKEWFYADNLTWDEKMNESSWIIHVEGLFKKFVERPRIPITAGLTLIVAHVTPSIRLKLLHIHIRLSRFLYSKCSQYVSFKIAEWTRIEICTEVFMFILYINSYTYAHWYFLRVNVNKSLSRSYATGLSEL